MKKSNTSAISSWLGYKTQEYRLVQRLLETTNGSCVGFEILDDLEEHNGTTSTLEQDKVSTTERNIVSNQSKDLWKTLSNWIDLINNGMVDADKTTFLLFTNKKCTSNVLEWLLNAKTKDEAAKAFDQILSIVHSPSSTIGTYVSNFAASKQHACALITNFAYSHGSGSAPHDLRTSYALHRLGAIEEHIDEIMFEIVGWTSDVLTLAAERKEQTVMSAKAFGERLGAIESRYRQKTILTYFCSRTSDSEDVLSTLKSDPNYIKQLNLIDVDSVELEEAAIANLEAKDAVVEWTLNGEVQDSSYRTYQRSLNRHWRIQRQKIHFDCKGHPETEIGERLYYECLDSVNRYDLEHKKVDDFFAHGTLHTMADDLTIGWHPQFDTELGDSDA
ncbi:ABC-three component system protein [Vibrio splendidus]